MKSGLFTLLILNLCLICNAQNQKAFIEILNTDNDLVERKLTINYNLYEPESEEVEISMQVSDQDGFYYVDITNDVTGDIGFPILTGQNLQLVWDYSQYITSASQLQIRLIADDRVDVDLQEIVDMVDADLLRLSMDKIEGIRHWSVNPAGLENARNELLKTYDNAGFISNSQEFTYNTTTGQNIIGDHIGTSNDDEVIILDAHYDTVDESPGADDNGSGVVGLIEAARILSQYSFNKTIRIIGFDLEEVGLRGSQYYVNNINPLDSILAVFNLEMIGYYTDEPNSQSFPSGFPILFPEVNQQLIANDFRGDFIANITLGSFTDLGDKFKNAATNFVPDLSVIDIFAPNNSINLLPDLLRSDHAPFWGKDIPALFITDTSEFRNENYHSPNDVAATLDFNFMANVMKATIATILDVAEVNHKFTVVETINFDPTSIDELNCQTAIYPNPITEEINLTIETCNASFDQIAINDMNGKTIEHVEINPGVQLIKHSTKSLNPGVYYFKFSSKTTGKAEIKKIIKF